MAAGGVLSTCRNNEKDAERIKGPWSPEEDAALERLVGVHGPRNWTLISRRIPGRSGKSCRLRWCNQLSPGVERRPFTPEEDETILQAHRNHGNKWATIARLLHGRTDNAVKNHWHSTLKRRCTPEPDRPRKRHHSQEHCFKPETPPSASTVSSTWSDHSSGSGTDDLDTSLRLAPPGSDPCKALNSPCSPSSQAPHPGLGTEDEWRWSCEGESEWAMRAEFLALMQEMIRQEVRSYMSGIQRSCG